MYFQGSKLARVYFQGSKLDARVYFQGSNTFLKIALGKLPKKKVVIRVINGHALSPNDAT